MEYKASFDFLSKTITTCVIVLFVFIGQASLRTIIEKHGDIPTLLMHSAIIAFLIAILVVSYLFSTQKYLLNKTELVIKRPVKEKRITISDIGEARMVGTSDMRGTIRTFGVGGLFGYYGHYHNRAFGSIALYTTQMKNRIFIRTYGGEKIIISPDDISLLDELKLKMPVRYLIS